MLGLLLNFVGGFFFTHLHLAKFQQVLMYVTNPFNWVWAPRYLLFYKVHRHATWAAYCPNIVDFLKDTSSSFGYKEFQILHFWSLSFSLTDYFSKVFQLSYNAKISLKGSFR